MCWYFVSHPGPHPFGIRSPGPIKMFVTNERATTRYHTRAGEFLARKMSPKCPVKMEHPIRPHPNCVMNEPIKKIVLHYFSSFFPIFVRQGVILSIPQPNISRPSGRRDVRLNNSRLPLIHTICDFGALPLNLATSCACFVRLLCAEDTFWLCTTGGMALTTLGMSRSKHPRRVQDFVLHGSILSIFTTAIVLQLVPVGDIGSVFLFLFCWDFPRRKVWQRKIMFWNWIGEGLCQILVIEWRNSNQTNNYSL